MKLFCAVFEIFKLSLSKHSVDKINVCVYVRAVNYNRLASVGHNTERHRGNEEF